MSQKHQVQRKPSTQTKQEREEKARFCSTNPLPSHTHTQAAALADLLLPMLDWSPDRRATAAEALRHPWLTGPPPAGFDGGERAGRVPDRPTADEGSPRRSRSPSPGVRGASVGGEE